MLVRTHLDEPDDEGVELNYRLRQVDGRRFGLESTCQLVQALRNTLLSRAKGGATPGWLSGHGADGRPLKEDHLSVLPLAFVGREHADGHLLGLALAVPRTLPGADVAEVRRLLEAEERYPYVRLVMGRLGECRLELDVRAETERPWTLRATTHTSPARRWASVTLMRNLPKRCMPSG